MKWYKEQLEILTENFGKMPLGQIAELTEHDIKDCIAKIREIRGPVRSEHTLFDCEVDMRMLHRLYANYLLQ